MKGERRREREKKKRKRAGVTESVSVRERDGEQKELQTKTSCPPCGDLISVVEGYLCWTTFGGDCARDSTTGECGGSDV